MCIEMSIKKSIPYNQIIDEYLNTSITFQNHKKNKNKISKYMSLSCVGVCF